MTRNMGTVNRLVRTFLALGVAVLTPFRALLPAAALLAAGCANRGDEAAPAARRDGGAGGAPLRIVATDTGFVAPARIAPGMRHIHFENQGTEIHEAMLVKLPEGMDAEGFTRAVKAGDLFPDGALDYSGPGLTSPGETTELWLRVDPGRFVLFCWAHARSTPAHSFTVAGDVIDDAPPREDLVLKLADFHFELTGQPKSGAQVFRIETLGPSMHEADLYRLLEGRTVADLVRWRKDGKGSAPARALGGALDSHDLHHVVWLRKVLVPGRYAFHCEMPVNTQAVAAGAEMTHADLGMVREFEVVE